MRGILLGVIGLALGVVAHPTSASAERANYRRRFVNRTSAVIAYYQLDRERQQMVYRFSVFPGFSRVDVVPRHEPNGWPDVWAADIGDDGMAVDVAANDFGTIDWTWKLESNK